METPKRKRKDDKDKQAQGISKSIRKKEKLVEAEDRKKGVRNGGKRVGDRGTDTKRQALQTTHKKEHVNDNSDIHNAELNHHDNNTTKEAEQPIEEGVDERVGHNAETEKRRLPCFGDATETNGMNQSLIDLTGVNLTDTIN